ncbi:hypothetical protein RhiXN_03994 [Rhizoctonia solani]|uniref:Uncharacterized protein n=1 Tax=Rhizoctonia solani TaxID=456999 RepID=A0A8H8NNX3_9AGAM|nr:uncharacterized protein RhiXN_03994 [Rhizoctonia solani]QRW15993.1 hypothetical protein RhiXN_03994 [Rhizoctonia solani]
MQQDRHRRHRDDSGDHLVLRNFDGSYNAHGGPSEGPRRFKRLLSLTGRPVPIESDDGPPAQVSSSPTRPNRKKESSKHRERVEPDTHSRILGEKAQRFTVMLRVTASSLRNPSKTSQKKPHAHTGPTKIALPWAKWKNFILCTQTRLLNLNIWSLTTTFHTAQSGNTRPGSPTRKMSSQSTHQVKASVPDTKYDGWRRSRAGAPRRPSQTLLASPPSNGNQYADEAPIMDDPPIFTTDPQEYDQELPGMATPCLLRIISLPLNRHLVVPQQWPPEPDLSPVPAPVAPRTPVSEPVTERTSVHIHIVHGPRIPSPAPARATATPTPDSPRPPVVSASPALASGPPPLIRIYSPPAISMPIPVPAPAPSPRVLPLKIERQLPSEPSEPPEPRPRSPSFRFEHHRPSFTTPDLHQTPPIQTPRAHTPIWKTIFKSIQSTPSRANRTATMILEVRSPVPDTPHMYFLGGNSYIDESRSHGQRSFRSYFSYRPGSWPRTLFPCTIREYRVSERPPTGSMLSNRPMPRHIAGLSESEHQMRQQNRQTGSEMSGSSLLRSAWTAYRLSDFSHSTPITPVDTGSSHTTRPRPDPSKELPAWYPREQMARNPTLPVPPERESRGPKIGQEAWVGAQVPMTPKDDSMPTPPVLPPKPVVPHVPEPEVQPSGEKKRVPKYRIEQDERGHPVLVPEPGSDDSRWTVFEIGGVEFKRAPGDSARATHWMPKRLSGLRRSEVRSQAHQYSESPAPVHAPLEGRQYNA